MLAMAHRRRTPNLPSMLLLLPFLLLAVSAASAAADEQDARGADRQALLEFKSAISADPAGLLTRWVGPDHCLWPGVSCAAARVVSLNLSAAAAACPPPRLRCPDSRRRLSGSLTPALAKLSELRSLSLPFHRFHGEIPRGIWRMRSLKALDLEGCSLSASLPPQFPARLAALNLDGNWIAGEIPRHLTNVVDSPLESPPSSSGGSWLNAVEIASITSAAAIIALLVALILVYIYSRKCVPMSSRRSPGRRELVTFVDVGVPLTYESVVRAAGGFSASNAFGNGGFGTIYKVVISPGVVLAIKRLSIRGFHGIQQFHSEIMTLGRWRHPNLVTLIDRVPS